MHPMLRYILYLCFNLCRIKIGLCKTTLWFLIFRVRAHVIWPSWRRMAGSSTNWISLLWRREKASHPLYSGLPETRCTTSSCFSVFLEICPQHKWGCIARHIDKCCLYFFFPDVPALHPLRNTLLFPVLFWSSIWVSWIFDNNYVSYWFHQPAGVVHRKVSMA